MRMMQKTTIATAILLPVIAFASVPDHWSQHIAHQSSVSACVLAPRTATPLEPPSFIALDINRMRCQAGSRAR